MHVHQRSVVAALLMICVCDGFLVKGPSTPLVVPLRSSVVLPCYVDEPLPMNGLKAIWIKTDSNALVHVFQDGESRPEAQYKDYYKRAHFFTEEIQHGNFSLRLENVRAEDKGFYRCKVYTEKETDEALVQIKSVEHLMVLGSDRPVSASVGEDVTLNCSVDSHVPPEEMKEVSWRKTDIRENIQVLVFEENRVIPADERYRDRAQFFADQIPKGNFSLRLRSVRTEDKGVYTCHVNAGNYTASATATLDSLGFSFLHILVLILCIAASGSSVVLSVYWYRCNKSQNKKSEALLLQMSLVSVPNIIMFFAFLFWGVIEGFLSESVACCAHYFLRPLLLLWASPHSQNFPGNRKTTMHCIVHLQYSLFTNVVYSVLFQSFWGKSLRYEQHDRVLITILFGIMILICITNIIFLLAELIRNQDDLVRGVLDLVSDIGHDVLPPLQLIFLFYAFEADRHALFVVGVFPLFLTLTRYNWKDACVEKLKYATKIFEKRKANATAGEGEESKESCSPNCLRSVRRGAWLGFMVVVNVIMVYSYLLALKKEKDYTGWACLAAFLQVLWGIVVLKHSFDDLDLPFRPIVYLIGSVGVILINSIALMTELILKVFNGERSLEDQRKVVFSSECLFVSSVLLLIMFEPFIKTQQKGQMQQDVPCDETPHDQSNQDQNAVPLHEMRPLLERVEMEYGKEMDVMSPQM